MKNGKVERSIFVDIREWFDKVNGNTYYSAIVTADSEWLFTTGMKYGYGSQAEYDVIETLQDWGIVDQFEPYQSTSTALRARGIDWYVAKSDHRKRDLPKKAERENLRDMTGKVRA